MNIQIPILRIRHCVLSGSAILILCTQVVIGAGAEVPTFIQDPETDSWYWLVATEGQGWEQMQTQAMAQGGQLAALETQEESAFVASEGLIASGHTFIGLQQDTNSLSYSDADPSSAWRWVYTGQAPSYLNWAPNDPNITSPSIAGVYSNGTWWDAHLDTTYAAFALYETHSSDCDSNGVPDTYEIALDPTLDQDLNGTLDICDGPGGPLSWEEDCNGNGELDSMDIASGGSTDWNADGRPDECTPYANIIHEHEGCEGATCSNTPLANQIFSFAMAGNNYLIGEPYYDQTNAPDGGRVCLRSGSTGALIFEWTNNNTSTYADQQFGFSMDASGDWDGDGFNDFLIGAPGYSGVGQNQNGIVYIFSGAPGTLSSIPILSIAGTAQLERLGYSVCFLDDYDGDGDDEYAISTPYFINLFGGEGQVTVYDGGTSTVLATFATGNSGELYGGAIASGGDATGDGWNDLLIGAPGNAATMPPGYGGRAELIDGVSLAVIANIAAAGPSGFTGGSLAFIDDLNGDDTDEFAIGSPRYDLPSGTTRAGRVEFFTHTPITSSGVTSISSIDGVATGDNLGTSLASLGDMNGDGFSEFAMGAPGTSAVMQPLGFSAEMGKVVFYDVDNQTVVREAFGRHVNDRFGYVMAGGSDLNGDGSLDLLVGNRATNSSPRMYGIAYSGEKGILGSHYCEPNEEHDADDDGVLETGLRALIAARGTTDLSAPGGSLTLTCDYMPISEFGIFYYGTNTLQVPFGPVGGWRCVGGGVSRLQIVNSGPEGRMVLHIDYANPPTGFNPGALVGQTRHFQCWFRDEPGQSGHFNLSDAVTLTFQ